MSKIRNVVKNMPKIINIFLNKKIQEISTTFEESFVCCLNSFNHKYLSISLCVKICISLLNADIFLPNVTICISLLSAQIFLPNVQICISLFYKSAQIFLPIF